MFSYLPSFQLCREQLNDVVFLQVHVWICLCGVSAGALKTPPLFPKTLLPVADHRGHLLGPALHVNQVRLKEVTQLLSYRYFLSGLTAGRVYSSGILGPGSFQGSFEGPRERCKSSSLGTCSAFECGSLLALTALTNGNSNGSSNRLFSIHWARLRLSLTFLLLFAPPQTRHWLLGILFPPV